MKAYCGALVTCALAALVGCAETTPKEPVYGSSTAPAATNTQVSNTTQTAPIGETSPRESTATVDSRTDLDSPKTPRSPTGVNPTAMPDSAQARRTDRPAPSDLGAVPAAVPPPDQPAPQYPPAPQARAPEPAPASAARPDATNTKINERDRSGSSLTPGDQGGSEAERTITQKIRQAVMADGALSFTAKNVKIITQGTRVTLRGPVKSDQERANIEAKARAIPGVKEVVNQIEVKN